jgi:aminopeptidase N
MTTLKAGALMFAAIALPVGSAISAAVPAPAPFSFDAAPGRLPKGVVPLEYRISIVPNVEKLIFSGTESVRLQFRSATAMLVFNSLNEALHDVRLDGRPAKTVASDDKTQLTTVTLATAAPTGTHTLTFSYQGRIEKQPHGLFVQPYSISGGGQGLLLSTQMQSTDARRVFPCWDEPAFRARFQLKAVVPANWAAVSNMPVASRVVHGALATVTFQRSPKMPSYLVEFSTGDPAQVGASSGAMENWGGVDRGMESARFMLSEKQALVPAADAYVQSIIFR